jgi:hypothetical protein
MLMFLPSYAAISVPHRYPSSKLKGQLLHFVYCFSYYQIQHYDDFTCDSQFLAKGYVGMIPLMAKSELGINDADKNL